MVKIVCDICGKEIPITWENKDYSPYMVILNSEEYDLCKDCFTDLKSKLGKNYKENEAY